MPAKKSTPTTAKAPKKPRENPLGAPRKKIHTVLRDMVAYALSGGGRFPDWCGFAAAQGLPVATVQRLSKTAHYVRYYGEAIQSRIDRLDLVLAVNLRGNALATLAAMMSDPDATMSARVKAAEVLLKQSDAAIARLTPSNPESLIDSATRLARDGVLPTETALALQTGILKTVDAMRLGNGDTGLTKFDLSYIELDIEPLDSDQDGDDLEADY